MPSMKSPDWDEDMELSCRVMLIQRPHRARKGFHTVSFAIPLYENIQIDAPRYRHVPSSGSAAKSHLRQRNVCDIGLVKSTESTEITSACNPVAT